LLETRPTVKNASGVTEVTDFSTPFTWGWSEGRYVTSEMIKAKMKSREAVLEAGTGEDAPNNPTNTCKEANQVNNIFVLLKGICDVLRPYHFIWTKLFSTKSVH
jgi:hypothetical protein